MSFNRFVLVAGLCGLFALAACSTPVGPATDCYYDKTAAAAPGYQVCLPAPVIHSQPGAGSQQ